MHTFEAVPLNESVFLIRRDDGKWLCFGRGHSQRRAWSRETWRAHRFNHPDTVECELRTLRKGAGSRA